MLPARLLLPVFTLITILEIIGDMANIGLLHYGCKPLIMLLLIAYAQQHRRLIRRYASLRWLFVGMFFALGGDVFLMIPGIDLFPLGLASFLVMQVCYILSFIRSVSEAGQPLQWSGKLVPLCIFVLYGFAFLYVLYAPITEREATKALWPAVIVYAICICSMGIAATLRYNAVAANSFTPVVAGAILFIISDSALALNKFWQPFGWSTPLVMSTYAAAQYLIVTGTFRQYIGLAKN